MAIPIDGLSIKLADYLADQGFRNDATGPGRAQIVMLRGCRRDGRRIVQSGDPLVYTDRYEDLMVVFGQKGGSQPFLATYRATAKPGIAWIKSSTYRGSTKGCPTVQPGQYPYKRGMHRTHRAMVQAGPVCVIRDLDQDCKLEVSDLVDYPYGTGINIHASSDTANVVGWNSSGCQVIRGGWYGSAWPEFYDLIYRVAAGQSIFHYTVVDWLDFGRWHDAADKSCYCSLRFGAHGENVEMLQRKLAIRGFFGAELIDGEFGRGTDRALRAYQRRHGLSPNGVIPLHTLPTL
jgi:hypothetical protein